MKKFLLIVVGMFFFYNASFGQVSTEQGTILLKAGISNFTIAFFDGTPMDLSLGGGYFVKDNICIGADFKYVKEGDNSASSILGFARYYFMEKFFAGAAVAKPYSFYGGIPDKEAEFKFAAEAGYLFSLNEYVAVEPMLRYPFFEHAKAVILVGISVHLSSM